MKTGKEIKDYIKRKRINKTGLAEKLKISRTTLYDWLDKDEHLDLIKESLLIDNSLTQQIGKLNSGGEMTVTANDGKGLKAEEHNTYYSDSGYKEAYYEAKERLKEAHEKIRELEEKLKRKK